MTVPSTSRKAGPFTGNGSTTFSFGFKVFTKNDISVVLTDSSGNATTLVLDSDYSVAVNADQGQSPGGTITYPISGSALPSTSTLTVVGNLDFSQGTQLPAGGAYNAQNIEQALDRVTILAQQLLEAQNRMVRAPVSDTVTTPTMPAATARASKLLGFDASGNPIAVAPTSGSASDLATQLASSTGAQLVGYGASTVKAGIDSASSAAAAAAGTANAALPMAGGTMSGALNQAPAVSVASAATTDIGAAGSNNVTITGTTTITSLGTIAAGAVRNVTFAGSLLLTYDATKLILPSAANITTQAGDTAIFLSLGSGNWRCLSYQQADGRPVNRPTSLSTASGSAPSYGLRAWGNFAGATGAANASGNMSCTRTGVGNYSISFPTAMPDANYAVSVMAGGGNLGNSWNWLETNTVTRSASGFSIGIATGGTAFDPAQFSVIVVR